MLSKNRIKQIQSLNRKKERDELGLFIVEGNKIIDEVLRSNFKIQTIICTQDFFDNHNQISTTVNELIITTHEFIQKASLLKNPQDAIAIVHKPNYPNHVIDDYSKLYLALDSIQDPGNLGTIIRIANWFGIEKIICSENTVDAFNPKVVQATMGAIFRVDCIYTNLGDLLSNIQKKDFPIYGTFLEGNNIYTEQLSKNGIIVLGNEGNGISQTIGNLITKKITIPTFTLLENKSESLNVAIATSIFCSEFRRRIYDL